MFPKKLQEKLGNRKANNALRQLNSQNNLVDFSSNDYLGFSKSETIFDNAHHFLIKHNSKQNGATGSRLLSGNHRLYNIVENAILDFEIRITHSPAWTTDWIGQEALEKLKKYGIAPPIKGTADKGVLFSSNAKTIECPLCNSKNTTLKSQFGSTACKSLYQCDDCLEPFDYFKCI